MDKLSIQNWKPFLITGSFRAGIMGLCLWAILLFLFSGCMNFKVVVGEMPNTAALEKSLKIGQSTRGEVETLLGKPFAEGRALLPPIHSQPTTMWTYYYEEGDIQESRRVMLFIYFDADLYNGYLWFSGFPE